MQTHKDCTTQAEWVWYGEDEHGKTHVSLGRWQSHPCQHRYKFAVPQPTEHDHDFTARDHLRALAERDAKAGAALQSDLIALLIERTELMPDDAHTLADAILNLAPFGGADHSPDAGNMVAEAVLAEREACALAIDMVEPDEEAAGGPATWGDFVQVAQRAIRARGDEGE